jgi:hypothetical protein
METPKTEQTQVSVNSPQALTFRGTVRTITAMLREVMHIAGALVLVVVIAACSVTHRAETRRRGR